MVKLIGSILLSILIWGYLISFKFAFVVIAALFIHEYGHFYWMGKEEIKDKDMFFIPPFGAIARAKEYWPSCGAELRIALAGPVFGLLSVVLFWTLYLVYSSDIFLASMVLACFINLFNLAFPIAVLDGGRVIKSILYSIHRSLGDAFYIFGLILLALVFVYGYLSIIFVLLIGYFLYSDWSNVEYHRSVLKMTILKMEALKSSGEYIPGDLEKQFSKFNGIVNLKKMNGREIITGLFFYLGLIYVYILVLYNLNPLIDLSLSGLLAYFQ